MVKNLCDYLFNMNPLPHELKDGTIRNEIIQVINSMISRNHHTHRVLLSTPGMVSDRLYVVEKGVVRGFKYDEYKKKEKTISLWDSDAIIAEANSFIHQIPSNLFIEVMPDTILLSISYEQLRSVFELFPFLRPFMSALISYDVQYSNKVFDDRNLSAWERLKEMRAFYPRLEQMVSKEIIASFLEITPQHLCKIIKDNSRLKTV